MTTLIGMYQADVVPDSYGAMPIHGHSGLVLEEAESVLWEGTAAAAVMDSVPVASAMSAPFTRLWQVAGPVGITITNLRTVYRVAEFTTLQMGRDVELAGAAHAYRTRAHKTKFQGYFLSGQVRHRWLLRVAAQRDTDTDLMLTVALHGNPALLLRVKLLMSNPTEELAQWLVRMVAAERLTLVCSIPDAEPTQLGTLQRQSSAPERGNGPWGSDYFIPYGYAVAQWDIPYTLKIKRARQAK